MSLLIDILDSTVIRTNPIDTNSNSSLADNLFTLGVKVLNYYQVVKFHRGREGEGGMD